MGPRSCHIDRFPLKAAIILVLVFVLACGCMVQREDGPRTPAPDPSTTLPGESMVNRTSIPPVETVVATVSLPLASLPEDEPAPEPATLRTFTFLSGSGTHTVSVAVGPPATGGPVSTEENCPLARWKPGNEGQVSAYYLGRISSASEQELFTALERELSRIRRMEGLNDDEYLELVTAFIQQIPYDPVAPLCPRTPSDVIRDGKGDCDEKSGLLLGLLSQAGFDVALLLFPDQHHATAGVRITSGNTPSFRVFGPPGKNYVYLETTRPTLIGLYQDSFASASAVVVPAGNGTIRYRAINDVMFVVGVQKRMEERMTFLLDTREEHLQEILRLEARLTEGDYDTQDEFSADYSRYARLITDYNQMGKDFTAIQEVHQYLLEHQYDRAGCRARIDNSKVELLL